MELLNIDESLPENAIIIFITKNNLKKTEYNYAKEDDYGNSFELSNSKKSIYNDSNIFMVSWWGTDQYSNHEHIQMNDI